MEQFSLEGTFKGLHVQHPAVSGGVGSGGTQPEELTPTDQRDIPHYTDS